MRPLQCSRCDSTGGVVCSFEGIERMASKDVAKSGTADRECGQSYLCDWVKSRDRELVLEKGLGRMK